jgi:hypothetical protein
MTHDSRFESRKDVRSDPSQRDRPEVPETKERHPTNPQATAAPLSDFTKFIGTDFERYILPIIPAGAKLAANSSLPQEQLGKIPGRWSASDGAWMGFQKWQDHYRWAKDFSLEQWEKWQTECAVAIAVGMNTLIFNCFDIDSDDPAIADMIENNITKNLADSPVVRLRHGSSRRVLFYEFDQHTAPIRKHRLAFRDSRGDQHTVEFLATGQQVVIEGPHAKGAMHYWRNGGLIEHRAKLASNLINGNMVATCFKALDVWREEQGFEKIKLALPAGGKGGPAIKIDDPMSSHLARDMDLLARCKRRSKNPSLKRPVGPVAPE